MIDKILPVIPAESLNAVLRNADLYPGNGLESNLFKNAFMGLSLEKVVVNFKFLTLPEEFINNSGAFLKRARESFGESILSASVKGFRELIRVVVDADKPPTFF